MLMPALATVALLLTMHTFRQVRLLRQEKFIIYSLRHHTAIDLIAGSEHVLLTDSLALADINALDYSLKNNRIALGLMENSHSLSRKFWSDFAYYRAGFAGLDTLRFYVPPPGLRFYPNLRKKIQVDYLICRSPGKIKLTEIAKAIHFRQVIMDASLSYWAVRSLKKQAKQLKINYLDLRKTGAFSIDFRGR